MPNAICGSLCAVRVDRCLKQVSVTTDALADFCASYLEALECHTLDQLYNHSVESV